MRCGINAFKTRFQPTPRCRLPTKRLLEPTFRFHIFFSSFLSLFSSSYFQRSWRTKQKNDLRKVTENENRTRVSIHSRRVCLFLFDRLSFFRSFIIRWPKSRGEIRRPFPNKFLVANDEPRFSINGSFISVTNNLRSNRLYLHAAPLRIVVQEQSRAC